MNTVGKVFILLLCSCLLLVLGTVRRAQKMEVLTRESALAIALRHFDEEKEGPLQSHHIRIYEYDTCWSIWFEPKVKYTVDGDLSVFIDKATHTARLRYGD